MDIPDAPTGDLVVNPHDKIYVHIGRHCLERRSKRSAYSSTISSMSPSAASGAMNGCPSLNSRGGAFRNVKGFSPPLHTMVALACHPFRKSRQTHRRHYTKTVHAEQNLGAVLKDVVEARRAPSRRLVGIEGLRGLAALSVVLHHTGSSTTDHAITGLAGNLASFAREGLTLFFVLSGFLLFTPFAAAILRGTPLPSIRKYAANRFLRIYPAYLVIFVLAALVIGSVYVRGSGWGLGPDNVGRLTDPLQILANLLIVQTYIPQYVLTGIGPAWSLTAEIAFYVALPLMAVIGWKLSRSVKNKLPILLLGPFIMIVCGLAIRVWTDLQLRGLNDWDAAVFEWGQSWSAVLVRSFLGQADLFAYGMLAAIAVVVMQDRGIEVISTRVKVSLLAVAGFFVIAGFTVLRSYTNNVTGVAAALLVLAVVLPSSDEQNSNRLARSLEWLPVRFAGLISYSIYLWHIPVILWVASHHLTFGSDTAALPLNLLLVLAIVLPLAAVTYYLVERPALSLKNRKSRTKEYAIPGARHL